MRFSKSTVTSFSKVSLNITALTNNSQNKLKYVQQNTNVTILSTFSTYILTHIFTYVNPFDTIILSKMLTIKKSNFGNIKKVQSSDYTFLLFSFQFDQITIIVCNFRLPSKLITIKHRALYQLKIMSSIKQVYLKLSTIFRKSEAYTSCHFQLFHLENPP